MTSRNGFSTVADRLCMMYVLAIGQRYGQEDLFTLEGSDIDLAAVRGEKALEEVRLKMRECIGRTDETKKGSERHLCLVDRAGVEPAT